MTLPSCPSCPPPLPHPRGPSSLLTPPCSSHVDIPQAKSQPSTVSQRSDYHQQQNHQDIRSHLEQLYLQHCHQQQQQQQQQHQHQQLVYDGKESKASSPIQSSVPATLLPHPYCPHYNILQHPLPHDTCDIGSSSYEYIPDHHLSNDMLVVDTATIQGLVLYTLYLLHRLRFFRWKHTHRLTRSSQHHLSGPSSTAAPPQGMVSSVSSSLTLSPETVRETEYQMTEYAQEGQSGQLDEISSPIETNVIDRSITKTPPATTIASSAATAKRDTITERLATTTREKNEDTSSSSSTFVTSSSSSTSLSSLRSSHSLSSVPMLSNILSSSSGSLSRSVDITKRSTASSHLSINTYLHPEILVQVFNYLAASHHTRTLIRCTLVCRSWYLLIGPLLWKSPRVLWSQHWSRYYPIVTTATRTSTSVSSSFSSFTTDSTGEFVKHGHLDDSGGINPLSLQLQLQQILLQQSLQRQQAWLQLWQTDRLKALASEQLHDQDRQELEHWLSWKKREKARRIREHFRRRQERAARQRRERNEANGQGLHSENSSRGGTIRNATSRPHSRSNSRDRSTEQIVTTSTRRRARISGTTLLTRSMLTSDNEDGDEESEIDDSGFSDRSDSEDDIDRLMSFDSEDEILSNSDYEDSDEETPLMKLVSRFDALHAWVSSSVTALSTLRDVASVSFILPSASITAASFWNVNRALVQTAQQQPQQQQLQLQQHQQQQSSRTPFKRVIARIRRRQAIRECRQRLAEIQPRDGLPVCLPLRTCGQWIQVINLQQEMPYHQRVMTQSFMQHPIPVRGRHDSTAHSRAIQLLQQQQQRQHGQREEGRFGAFRSVLQHLAEQIQGAQIAVTEPSEPERLLSRRDFVNDWTIKTIMDYCPGLCRLTLSECHGITDRSLELIRDSACVASQTLVSLHLAGCYQITDRGLLALAGNVKSNLLHRTRSPTSSSTSSILSSSLSSSSSFPSALDTTLFSTTTSSPNYNLRLESLDFAGCYQISDRGLIPLLKRCGSRLQQLRVSDCENISSISVLALANHCPNTQWLDLCRTGTLTEECLILLAERCSDLEWLNLARMSPQLESLIDISSANEGSHDIDANNDNIEPGDQNINEGNGDGGEIIEFEFGKSNISPSELQFFDSINSTDDDNNNKNDGSQDSEEESGTEDPLLHRYQQQAKEDSITDRALELLCESCPKLQLLDLSYISTITNSAMESLSETAKSLVCLTIIGCPGITSQSLLYLARLRNNSGKLGCITMGDALGISERDIEQIMQGTLSGWQKSLVDETNLGEILGRSWDE